MLNQINSRLNKIKVNKKAQSISTFDFSNSNNYIPHKLLLRVFS